MLSALSGRMGMYKCSTEWFSTLRNKVEPELIFLTSLLEDSYGGNSQLNVKGSPAALELQFQVNQKFILRLNKLVGSLGTVAHGFKEWGGATR
jgi:hypothetical protein